MVPTPSRICGGSATGAKLTLLVILQCPWKKGRLQKWHPSIWRKEFLTSRTGGRLMREVLPDNARVRFCNANPKLVETASDFLPPDIGHVRRRVRACRPDAILACGLTAKRACAKLATNIPVFYMQHPASRALPFRETAKTRKDLTEFFNKI